MDGRRPRQGRVLQRLGTYDPRGGGGVTLDDSALQSWLARGAQMSDTVRTLLLRRRKQAPESAEAPQESAPAS